MREIYDPFFTKSGLAMDASLVKYHCSAEGMMRTTTNHTNGQLLIASQGACISIVLWVPKRLHEAPVSCWSVHMLLKPPIVGSLEFANWGVYTLPNTTKCTPKYLRKFP